MTKKNSRRLLQYEHRSQPILSRSQFVQRILGHIFFALSLLVISLRLPRPPFFSFSRPPPPARPPPPPLSPHPPLAHLFSPFPLWATPPGGGALGYPFPEGPGCRG